MPLPSIGNGYQLGDGNAAEVNVYALADPQTATGTATLTAAQMIASGVLVGNPGASAASYTLPTVAALEIALGGANVLKTNVTFELKFVNLGNTSGIVTFVAGTGWTIVGRAAVPITTGATLVCRKTGNGTWTMYIVG